MQQSQRSSAASSGYGSHAAFASPPSGSPTSSVYDARSSTLSQPPLSIAVPPFSSTSSPSLPSKQPQDGLSNPSQRPVSADLPSTPRTVVKSVRRASIDSPRSALLPKDSPLIPTSPTDFTILEPRNLDEYPHGHTPTRHSTHSSTYSTGSDPFSLQDSQPPPLNPDFLASAPRPPYERSATSYHTANDSVSDYDRSASDQPNDQSRQSIMSSNKSSPKPPELTLQVDSQPLAESKEAVTKKPKSPGMSSFFGWKRSASNQNESPTTISDSISASPAPSPLTKPELPSATQPSPVLGEEEDDYFMNGSYYDSASPNQGAPPSASADELLRELREVSAELAASIRREMELEDEVDKYKPDMPTGPGEQNRRTSDYYSDSGASSIRIAPADSETKIEGLEKMRRKAEQEKAQLRLEMTQKAQEDLNQRRALEMHVQSLEQQLESRERSVEHQREMDDVKRKLTEERQFKENFEDLLSGMREEIEAHKNERDNLRDEVVPQLKSRIEGLESQATEMQTLTYENTRLQQELQNTKNENETLQNARRLQLESPQNARFKTIAEEEEDERSGGGLTRSGSRVKRSNSLIKSKDGQPQSDGDGFKALEDQRDALQRTLKNLILRQQAMEKKHNKQLRSLEAERDKVLNGTPRRKALQNEVHELRHEINRLRRRADDALEQKWQSEKGLSSLKMDLDRAQHETGSLRELLQGDDTSATSDGNKGLGIEGADSLDAAYASLQSTHADSMALLQSRADKDNDEDALKLVHISRNRMRDLSKQVESQLTLNAELQERLREAVDRGVKEQQVSSKKIADLESALRAAEEQVISATNISEDAVSQEEEYVKTMSDAATEQSRRGISRSHAGKSVVNDSRSSKDISKSALNSPFNIKSPRLDMPGSGKSVTASESTRAEALQQRVRELEDAAMRADKEMQGLVEKMSRAQIEVAELQMERDESTKQTRRLQREILAERERIKALTS